jgi:hypothetical protein
MRNVSKKFTDKIKTHVLCSVTSFRKSFQCGDGVRGWKGRVEECAYWRRVAADDDEYSLI